MPAKEGKVGERSGIKSRLGRSPDRGDAVVIAFTDLIFGEPRALHWITIDDEPDENMGLGKALEL